MDHIMNDDTIHNNLVTWITKKGGTIHRNLALYTPQIIRSSGDDIDTKKKNYSHRGIFAKQGRISKGEMLIRLPSTLALDGSKLPSSYTTSTTYQNNTQLKSTKDDNASSLKRNASPWLRCMAQLINSYDNQQTKQQHDNEQNYNPYLESLPKEYDSLLNWSTIEIKSFLKGTALCTSSTSSTTSDDDTNVKDDENDRALRERFVKTVVPYLSYLKNNGHFLESDSKQPSKRQKVEESSTDDELEQLYPLFREGCMCISTRAFHMQSANATTTNNKECYQGPFLLPYIDLLNHASRGSTNHVTTLSRDTDGSFIMAAERDIAVDEEICHSYDSGSQTQSTEEQSSSLNSAQLLQTFGFVDVDNISKRLLDYHQQQDNNSENTADSSLLDNITPVVLTKKDISKACTQLASSSYPDTIRTFMNQSGMIDEGWECWGIPPMNDSRSNLLALYSDEILVPFRGAISDELISICCVHFLSDEVLNDLLDEPKESGAPTTALLLGSEVLDDYFLGKLVLQAILNVLKEKLTTYQVCPTDLLNGNKQHYHTREFINLINGLYRSQHHQSDDEAPCYWGKSVIDDVNVLSKLMTCEGGEDVAGIIQKFKCGMVISLEERTCLLELKNKVLDMIVNLDDG